MPDSGTNTQRNFRLFVATAMVALFTPWFLGAANATGSEVIPLACVYVGFLIACGVLQVLIASRLYQQHEVREYKVDIGAMLLITTLIALPFGAASVAEGVQQFFKDGTLIVDPPPGTFIPPGLRRTSKPMGPWFYFFLMIPVFFIAENLVTRWSDFRRWRRRKAKDKAF